MISWLRSIVRNQPAAARRAADAAVPAIPDTEYARWIAAYDTSGSGDAAVLKAALGPDAPLVSVIIDPRGASPRALEQTLRSISEQSYPSLQTLVLPFEPKTLASVHGAFIAPVAAGDILAPHALAVLVAKMREVEDASFIYSDEDVVDDLGPRRNPYFKGDWDADLALVQDYACRLALIRSKAARQAGGFQGGSPRAALYDLTLRLSETAAPVLHAPFVLYHRASPQLAAPDTERQMAEMANQHLTRTGASGRAAISPAGSRRIIWPLPSPLPLVSLLVPTRDRLDLLRTCLDGLRFETSYPNLEILVLDNESAEPATHDYLRSLSLDPRIQVLHVPGAFNFPHINNVGAAAARGEIIGLINNDLKVMEADWLSEMVGQASRPDVGAVGAMLLYADGAVQHAGCVLGIGGVASHIYKRASGDQEGHGGRMQVAQGMSAVTAACLLTRKTVWDAMNGFDETLAVAYNDVDYCLRVRDAGLRVVWTPHARLYHLESATRGDDKDGARRERLEQEKAKMADRWGDTLLNDPFFSPNLSLKSTDCKLAFGPRVRPPWDLR